MGTLNVKISDELDARLHKHTPRKGCIKRIVTEALTEKLDRLEAEPLVKGDYVCV